MSSERPIARRPRPVRPEAGYSLLDRIGAMLFAIVWCGPLVVLAWFLVNYFAIDAAIPFRQALYGIAGFPDREPVLTCAARMQSGQRAEAP